MLLISKLITPQAVDGVHQSESRERYFRRRRKLNGTSLPISEAFCQAYIPGKNSFICSKRSAPRIAFLDSAERWTKKLNILNLRALTFFLPANRMSRSDIGGWYSELPLPCIRDFVAFPIVFCFVFSCQGQLVYQDEDVIALESELGIEKMELEIARTEWQIQQSVESSRRGNGSHMKPAKKKFSSFKLKHHMCTQNSMGTAVYSSRHRGGKVDVYDALKQLSPCGGGTYV